MKSDNPSNIAVTRFSIQRWERGIIWLVLAAVILNTAAVLYVVSSQWSIVVEGVLTREIHLEVFLAPCLLLAAGILLLLRNKWALPAFFVHIVVSLGGIAILHGFASIPWYFWLGYLAELGIVSFCLRLLGRGILK